MGLIFISIVFVSSPLIQRYGSVNRVDVAFVTLVFGGVIALESIIILFLEYLETNYKFIKFLTYLTAGLFLCMNIFNFFFVLTNLRPYVYFLMCTPLVILLIYSTHLKCTKCYSVFFYVKI